MQVKSHALAAKPSAAVFGFEQPLANGGEPHRANGVPAVRPETAQPLEQVCHLHSWGRCWQLIVCKCLSGVSGVPGVICHRTVLLPELMPGTKQPPRRRCLVQKLLPVKAPSRMDLCFEHVLVPARVWQLTAFTCYTSMPCRRSVWQALDCQN